MQKPQETINRSRRAFLTGQVKPSQSAEPEVHITSYVVQTRPDKTNEIITAINRFNGAEIHGKDDHGKMVLTLETDSETNIAESIIEINSIPGVINTSLVYHQIDGEDGL